MRGLETPGPQQGAFGVWQVDDRRDRRGDRLWAGRLADSAQRTCGIVENDPSHDWEIADDYRNANGQALPELVGRT